MDPDFFKDLLRRYLDDSLSVAELKEFLRLLQSAENQEIMRQTMMDEFHNPAFHGLSDGARSGSLFQNILGKASEIEKKAVEPEEAKPIRTLSGKNPFIFLKYAAAAAVLILLFTGIYFQFFRHQDSHPALAAKAETKPLSHDALPGSNKAMLTLGDGSRLALNDSARGIIALQGSTKIQQSGKGVLTYDQTSQQPTPTLYNTVATGRGGQFEMKLPDGSKVWLNAASSLRFPTAFSGKSRNVVLTGEAYFEIAPDKDKPFTVETGNTKVEVLGTRFNVMAYEEEAKTKTTLLEGSVRLLSEKDTRLLRPGQQAQLDKGDAFWRITGAYGEEAIAWKNGFFQFHSDDMGTIMRQLGRWYDVDVAYAGKIPEGHFSGSISRQTLLSKVLAMLAVNDVHFRVEGKKLIVL
ncbi:MAG: FecR domain-containing protein [Bacteroidota bacterium]|nr:FecR domain-containing protein [Bacteroidota bacterium]